MTVAITIEVSDELGRQLQRVENRLPEVLERGLWAIAAEEQTGTQDEQAIIRVLASQPTPEQVLALQPSAALQARASDLLARSKGDVLMASEATELERYLLLEHLVRLAKAQALKQ